MSFKWQIHCTACQWQITINALLPFAQQAVVENPHLPIEGFWEDYICPRHYHTARRTLHFVQPMPDMVAAYEAYFEGAFTTTPVPLCSDCQQPMEGGQVLERLPFFLDRHLDAYTWLHQKLLHLYQLFSIERQAVVAGETTADQVLQLLAAETTTLSRFFTALLKELGIPEAISVMDDLPESLHTWETVMVNQLEHTQHRIAQLDERRYKEGAKIAGWCPRCHQQRVYLYRKETF